MVSVDHTGALLTVDAVTATVMHDFFQNSKFSDSSAPGGGYRDTLSIYVAKIFFWQHAEVVCPPK